MQGTHREHCGDQDHAGPQRRPPAKRALGRFLARRDDREADGGGGRSVLRVRWWCGRWAFELTECLAGRGPKRQAAQSFYNNLRGPKRVVLVRRPHRGNSHNGSRALRGQCPLHLQLPHGPPSLERATMAVSSWQVPGNSPVRHGFCPGAGHAGREKRSLVTAITSDRTRSG